jgi:hypothetical protein
MSFNKAEIGRIDKPLQSIGFTDGETIDNLLTKASITLSSGEQVRTESGDVVELNEVADSGETYFVVPNYKNAFQ